jgi:hypothetical protein
MISMIGRRSEQSNRGSFVGMVKMVAVEQRNEDVDVEQRPHQ